MSRCEFSPSAVGEFSRRLMVSNAQNDDMRLEVQ
jgi:hypothetical protein